MPKCRRGDEREWTVGEMFGLAMNWLPLGHRLELSITQGEVSLTYGNPWGASPERCHDDMTTGEMILDYINAARESEGLTPVPECSCQGIRWQSD